MGLVATQQILFPNYLNENILDCIKKENSSYLNLLDYVIWGMMKKMLYKNVKQYYEIEELSAAISNV